MKVFDFKFSFIYKIINNNYNNDHGYLLIIMYYFVSFVEKNTMYCYVIACILFISTGYVYSVYVVDYRNIPVFSILLCLFCSNFHLYHCLSSNYYF